MGPQFRVATNDPFAMFDLVLEGIGIAILPLYLARQSEISRRLVPILPLWVSQPITHYALYFGSTRVVPKVRVFLDYVAEFLGTDRDPRIGDSPSEGLFARQRYANDSGDAALEILEARLGKRPSLSIPA